ncbi:MAG: cupredoxin domain-containing protein [Woeseiaceae bacterium]|jgi:hypothetical protein
MIDRKRTARLFATACAVFAILGTTVQAAPPAYEIEIRNHLFEPDEITIPANTKVKLVVINRDPTPEEFESFELNREKVIMGGSRAIIFIGPLPPGEYPFFGEFNPDTALGKIIVSDDDAG